MTEIENLTKQYNVILVQYQKTYTDYINYLNSNTTNTSNQFITVPHSSFWGTSSLSDLQNTTVNDCMNKCSLNSNCTGATFLTNNSNCFLRKGDGKIIKSTDKEQTAIVLKSQYYNYQLQLINEELIRINKQMLNTINKSYPLYENTLHENSIKQQILQKNYDKLLNDKMNINKMIRDYDSLQETQDVTSFQVTQHYYRYVILLVITIILFVILINSTAGNQNNRVLIFILVIIIFVLLFTSK